VGLSPCIGCLPDATESPNVRLESCVRRAAGGPGAGTTFNCRPTQQAVMQLVTRYPGVRHRIVHDAAQVLWAVRWTSRHEADASTPLRLLS
jgi:hypothetical protein